MSNTLGVYNPTFYAQEGLIALEEALGMAKRVHMGFDAERRTYNLGDTISIRRPSVFSAQSAPSSAQDVTTETVNISLSSWQEVKFKLTDKEFAYTGQRIIADHIRPAAYALAEKIDTDLCALYKDVPYYYDVAGGASTTTAIADLTGLKQVMFDRAIPFNDPTKLHLMIDSGAQNALEQLAGFSQWQGAGPAGVETQMNGGLGRKFGMNVFANQNVASHTKGTCNDTALQTKGTAVAGATTIDLDAVDAGVTGTLVAGDVITITHTTRGATRYCVTATNTASGNEFLGVAITPPLKEATTDNLVVTARLDNHVAMLGFHQDAFALAFAKLPDYSQFGSRLGQDVFSVQDPTTGLSMRAAIYSVGNSSEIHVKLDVLYGVKTLNPWLAARLCG